MSHRIIRRSLLVSDQVADGFSKTKVASFAYWWLHGIYYCHCKTGLKTIKNWYGCQVPDTMTLMELYKDFVGGKPDHQMFVANALKFLFVAPNTS